VFHVILKQERKIRTTTPQTATARKRAQEKREKTGTFSRQTWPKKMTKPFLVTNSTTIREADTFTLFRVV
jgi:hypothetical protein